MTYGSVQRAYWLSFYRMGCVTFGSRCICGFFLQMNTGVYYQLFECLNFAGQFNAIQRITFKGTQQAFVNKYHLL
jgi:hypothetical protein